MKRAKKERCRKRKHGRPWKTKGTNFTRTKSMSKVESDTWSKGRKSILALKSYSKAIQKASRNDVLFTNKALCFIKLKRFDEACSEAREAIAIAPNRCEISYLKFAKIWIQCERSLPAGTVASTFGAIRWRSHCAADSKFWGRSIQVSECNFVRRKSTL